MHKQCSTTLTLMSALLLASCGGAATDPQAGAPPPLKVERVADSNVFTVDHPSQFPLVSAVEYLATPRLDATATVSADVSRTVPVISLAAGRVIEIKARLGDTVKKGQVLLRVQSADIAGAFSDYQKAWLTKNSRAPNWSAPSCSTTKGAISLNDLQVAQDAETKAKVDVKTTTEKLRVLGNTDLDQPTGIVEIRAPISGVITDQQVTNAAGVAGPRLAQSFYDFRPDVRLDSVRRLRK